VGDTEGRKYDVEIRCCPVRDFVIPYVASRKKHRDSNPFASALRHMLTSSLGLHHHLIVDSLCVRDGGTGQLQTFAVAVMKLFKLYNNKAVISHKHLSKIATPKGGGWLQTLVLRHNHLSCERQSDCAFMTSSDAPLPRLRTLDLADNLLISGDDQDGGAGVRFSADVFPALVELDLTGNRLTAVVVGALGNLARLQTLRLSDNPLTDIESGALDGLTALIRLELDRCARLTHLRAGALAGLNKLRVLTAHDSGLVHLHHAVFAHLTHLEELYLRNNHLGDQVYVYCRSV